MHYVAGVIGLIVFLVLAWAPSSDRRLALAKLKWVAIMLAIQFGLALLLLKTPVGTAVISSIGTLFEHLLAYAHTGTAFVFGGLSTYTAKPDYPTPAFFMSVLMPIVLISALIGILRWLKILPLIIKYLGIGLSYINGMGRLESYNAVASAVLGQSEVFISVKKLLPTLSPQRMYTLCASAMSTVSMSIVGSYMVMIQPRYVVAAILLNLFGGFIVVSLINPYTPPPTTDDIHDTAADAERQSFFEMLSEYILDGFKVAIIVGAMLIGFIALIALLNAMVGGIFGWFDITLNFQGLMGYAFAPFAWLTGIPWHEAANAGNLMATKLVSNEFAAMLDFNALHQPGGKFGFNYRTEAIVSTFLVSFANFSSIGIIAGAVNALSPEQGRNVAKFGTKLLYGASLVSFISATIVGLVV